MLWKDHHQIFRCARDSTRMKRGNDGNGTAFDCTLLRDGSGRAEPGHAPTLRGRRLMGLSGNGSSPRPHSQLA
jgi:hypothetical protein